MAALKARWLTVMVVVSVLCVACGSGSVSLEDAERGVGRVSDDARALFVAQGLEPSEVVEGEMLRCGDAFLGRQSGFNRNFYFTVDADVVDVDDVVRAVSVVIPNGEISTSNGFAAVTGSDEFGDYYLRVQSDSGSLSVLAFDATTRCAQPTR